MAAGDERHAQGHTDYDGLSDKAEVRLHTDPLLWDTDGDGRGDGSEIATRTDPTWRDRSFRIEFLDQQHLPTAQDPDGDGLPERVERQLGTDIDNPDTDGDGLGDWVEMLRHTNPRTAYSGGIADRTTDLEDVEREIPDLRAAERAKMVPEGIYDDFGNRIVFPGDDMPRSAPVSTDAMVDPVIAPSPPEDAWAGSDYAAPDPLDAEVTLEA